MSLWAPLSPPALPPRQMPDLRLAASQMTGAARRALQAALPLTYCRGRARRAATLWGWRREAVAVGWAAHRTGMLCLGAQAAGRGRKRWEEQAPEAAAARRQPRRGARRARLRAARPRPLGQRGGRQGAPRSHGPHPAPGRRGSTGGARAGAQGSPPRRSQRARQPRPSWTLEQKAPPGEDAEPVQRGRLDGQAPVQMGAVARGGHTRGAHQARAQALGCQETESPWGSVDADPAPR